MFILKGRKGKYGTKKQVELFQMKEENGKISFNFYL